jgi:hypothetical protein
MKHCSSFRITVACAALISLATIATPAVVAGAASSATPGPALVVPSTWRVASTPATNPLTFTLLNGVSCVGPVFCMAVGRTQVGANFAPLVERYDGSWSILSAPSPSGGTGGYFSGVSCTGPDFCAAVGVQYPGAFEQNFTEIWNGTSWSIKAAPDRSASANGSLSGISCANPTFCIAVGGDAAGGTDESLVERWNGTKWSIVTDAPSGGLQPELNMVSCLSTSFCSAVGASFAGTEVPYTEFWNGTSWTIAATPAISGATQSLFSGVSCALPTMCMAAGYQHAGSASGNLVERWNGTVWKVQSVPKPQLPAVGFPFAVDCFGPTSCVLVGQATLGMGTGTPLVVTWDGTTWSSRTTPHPGYQASLADAIHGISCVGGSWCVGVGAENDSSSFPQPMVLTAAIPRPGYLEVASDGGLFAFGDARFYGSMGGQSLNKPIVGMAATPDGGGYLEVASDGGDFAFGDAHFYGSMGGQPLNKPIVGIAISPGGGYYEVATDGGLFAFGVPFDGSMGGQPLNEPIVGMALAPAGGYFEVASDGGLFAFGGAVFQGSMGGQHLNEPIVGVGQ